MTIKEIIEGLKFTVDMFLFDTSTGEIYKEPRNDMDKITINACKGAIELLEQTQWIPVSERLPEKNMACLVAVGKFNLTQIAIYSDLMGIIDHRIFYQGDVGHDNFKDITGYVKAWMPLPQTYKAESEE